MIFIVKKCAECPFFAPKDAISGTCSVSTPHHRPLALGDERPSFCLLRREQVIVREFQ